jgi:hypothetical protein
MGYCDATKSRPRCRRNCGLNTTVSNNTENRRSARSFFCISCNNGSSDNTTERIKNRDGGHDQHQPLIRCAQLDHSSAKTFVQARQVCAAGG